MAKGFQRQGDWQTGYVQRSVPTRDAKVAEQKAIQLAKRADEETKKRVQSAKQLEAEAKRIFEVQTGLDRYEAQKAADMSATFKNFLTKTVTSIAKSAQDQARAEGDAARILEDEVKTEEVFYDQTGKKIETENLQEITDAANKNLKVITEIESKVAAPLEKIGELDRANKARGMFSSAYKYGYDNRSAALAVEGFSAKLKAELDTSEILLQRKEDEEPWMIKDAKSKDQLRFASAYLTGKFVDENRGDLGDITVAEVLGKPARKVVAKELKTRFDNIDLEFKETRKAAIVNSLSNSMEMNPGATSLADEIRTLETRLRPYLTATETKSKGAQLKEIILDTYKDVLARSANPNLVHQNFLNIAGELPIDSSMGKMSLSQIDKAKFSKTSLNLLFAQELSKRHTREVNSQKAGATIAIINKSEEISQKMEAEGKRKEDYQSEILEFQGELYKTYPYARGEIIDMMSKFYRPTIQRDDTILAIREIWKKNGGVVPQSELVKANVDMEIAQAYMKDHNLKLVEESNYIKYKDHVQEKERDAEKIFGTINKATGVLVLEPHQTEAVDQFNWEVSLRANQILDAANEKNITLTYEDAYNQAYGEKTAEVTAGLADKTSKWYAKIFEGTRYFSKTGVDPLFLGLEDVEIWNEVSVKANGTNGKALSKKLWIKEPERLNLTEGGYSDDPLIQRISRLLGVSESDFVEAQRKKLKLPEVPDTDDQEVKEIITNNVKESKSKTTLDALNRNNNSSTKVGNRVLNEVLPMSGLTIGNSFVNSNMSHNVIANSLLRNEVTGEGLLLDADQIEGDHIGHAYFGKTSGFGERKNPDERKWKTIVKPKSAFSYWGAGLVTEVEKPTEYHYGVDIGTSNKDGVQTAFGIRNGEIIANDFTFAHDIKKEYDKNNGKDYGNVVTILDKDTGAIYRFAHLAEINPELTVGAKYNGQVIGIIGKTGRSFLNGKPGGPHLHFEKINAEGIAVDPVADGELKKLSMGSDWFNPKAFIGKYPMRRDLLAQISGPALKKRFPITEERYLRDEALQDRVWKYANDQLWKKSVERAGAKEGGVEEFYTALRMHFAELMTGNHENYIQPTIWSLTDDFLDNLRKSNGFK